MPELPTSLTQPAKEPVIYTIPEQFYGVAAKAQLPKAAPVPAQTMPPAVPGGPAPASPAGGVSANGGKPQGGQSRKWLLIPVFALLLLAGLGFAAWWFLQPKAPPAPAPVTPVVTQPEPTPEPEPQPQPEPEPATTTTETPPAAPAPEADVDADGLTTAEEALFGTNPDVADSDSDGFNDSVEVINLYNPTAVAPKKLIEAGLVKAYDGAGFEFLVPTSWIPSEGTGGHLVSFEGNAGESIFVDAQDNPDKQSALDWYLTKNPSASPSQAQAFTTKSGLAGVRSPDGLSAYIPIGDKMYVFTDAPLDTAKRSFASTFSMMVNSFSKKP